MFIRFFIAALMLTALGGCVTTYSIDKHPDGSVSVMVKSYRELEKPVVHFNRMGEDVTFDFGAESATTAVSPVEQAVGDVLRAGGTIATSGILKPVDGN